MAKSRGKSSRAARTSAKPAKPERAPAPGRAEEPRRRAASSPDKRSGGARFAADEREGRRGEGEEEELLGARGSRYDEEEDHPDDLGRERVTRDDEGEEDEGRIHPRSSRTRD